MNATCLLLAWLIVPSVAWAQNFSDDFSVPADRLDRSIWTTEIGAGSFLGRTQLRDWVTEGGVGRFVVADGSARLSLDTFNPTGFSLYGTHAKTRVSFQPSPTTEVVLAFRMRLTSLQRGLVYGLYFYGCGASCATDHDEVDIEVVSNYLQAGGSPLRVQLNRYAAEPLGAGHGPVVDLPPGFDPLAYHEWKIRWGASRLTYYVDEVSLFSTTTFVPQRPMHADMIVWGPASDWSDAYDPSLQAVDNAGANQAFVALIDRFAVTGVGRDDLALDFGAAGLWTLYNNGPFARLHTVSPGAMATGDLDGNGKAELIVDFSGSGVWVWSNDAGWFQLHTVNAASIATGDLDGNGLDEVLLDFPGFGLWVRVNNSGWFQLHAASPSRMVTADLDGSRKAEAILDFQGAGVWVWKNNTSWSQLHPANIAAIVAGDFDGSGRTDLLLDFPGAGLWVWSNNTSWFQPHTADATVMTTGDLDGNGKADAIISFPGFGIWAWMNSAGFVQLHASNAALMTAADIDGSGRDDVIISFAGFGVWAWMNHSSWQQLHTQNPEGMAVGNLDGN